jgi:endonuclease YncB( thermonuclease family)
VHRLAIWIGLAAVAALAAGQAAALEAATATERAVVGSVTDGDTLRLRDGRRVRLVQVDSPELGTGECYSRAARTALLALAPLCGPRPADDRVGVVL